ncbi:hypothetical protein B0T21DRAFT_107269 [Apiosordaria backusii]|uniref:Uncharacterized protein n=1 Tax=Apiosordaria backusii TaxID=314023 RepID=A0AA40DKH2_9PEZI|nr:hypothetical protein B0T21DRAFT_107269 [Apiosordaria backusii]
MYHSADGRCQRSGTQQFWLAGWVVLFFQMGAKAGFVTSGQVGWVAVTVAVAQHGQDKQRSCRFTCRTRKTPRVVTAIWDRYATLLNVVQMQRVWEGGCVWLHTWAQTVGERRRVN